MTPKEFKMELSLVVLVTFLVMQVGDFDYLKQETIE